MVERLFPNCDGWGAKDWFERLVHAVEQRDIFAASGHADSVQFQTHNNIAAASASRLAREFKDEVLSALSDHDSALTAAHRRIEELTRALPDLSAVITWLENGCEPKHAATELRIYQERILASKQGGER